MEYILDYTAKAEESIRRLFESNPKSFSKLEKLLNELRQHPRTGTGHPEALKSGRGDLYSRRITKKDRLVYRIDDSIVHVLVISAEGHYEDK